MGRAGGVQDLMAKLRTQGPELRVDEARVCGIKERRERS